MLKSFSFNSVLITLFVLFYSINVHSQVAYEHIQSTKIYDFLDEMASMQIIELNSTIKPYSRTFIAEQLIIAQSKKEELNNRQQKELELHLEEYAIENKEYYSKSKYSIFNKNSSFDNSINPLSINYYDSNFRATIRPIAGRTYDIRDDKEYRYHNRIGANFVGYIGNNLSIYASLRDNYQKNDIYSQPNFLTLYEGGSHKVNNGGRLGADYSEMRGGITYAWIWGNIGLVKDHLEWGDNNHGSNILSGRTPSFASVKLNLKPAKWFELNYFHGWLVSMEIDSSRSYTSSTGVKRKVFSDKYIAANMFTIRPFKNFSFSFGNSIVYSDKGIQAAYLIPVMFFKSIDHTLTRGVENENSQMFFNLSSRNIKNIHLYASFFIDEFSKTRIGDPKRTNFISYKAGLKTSNFLVENISLTAEYTHTKPMTFKHRVPSTTFETNRYNLGNYLVDNAEEIYLALNYKPHYKVGITASFTQILKGNDYPYLVGTNLPKVDEFEFLRDIIWNKQHLSIEVNYQILNTVKLEIGVSKSIIKTKDADNQSAQYYLNKFTSAFEQGNHFIFRTGLNIGF
ncbi:MAG: hypothetical protein PHR79_08995 [Bacteroidales bacterium]|nr:hypothetical protein [Bacteroidales bacterium]